MILAQLNQLWQYLYVACLDTLFKSISKKFSQQTLILDFWSNDILSTTFLVQKFIFSIFVMSQVRWQHWMWTWSYIYAKVNNYHEFTYLLCVNILTPIEEAAEGNSWKFELKAVYLDSELGAKTFSSSLCPWMSDS